MSVLRRLDIRDHLATLSALTRPYWVRYRQLPPRDRRRIAITVVMVGAVLLYTLLLAPAWQYSHRARAALAQEQSTWQLLQNNAEAIRQLNAARQAKTGQDTSLLALASKTASEQQLTLLRYEPAADGKLSLWLSEVEFGALLPWLDQLVQHYAVRIDHLVVTPAQKPGTVEVQVVLRQ